MGNFKLSFHMLKKEYKKNIAYTLTLSITMSAIFLFFNILDNPYLAQKASLTNNELNIPFSTTLSFVVIFFCGIMIVLANNFYVSKKNNEIAILTLSGSSFLKVTAYLIYQNLIMTCIAFVIGLFLGYILTININQFIYSFYHYQVSYFYVPLVSFRNTIASVIAILFAQITNISGYIYRNDISTLIRNQENAHSKRRSTLLPSKWYGVGFVFFGLMLIDGEYSLNGLLLCCICGSVMSYGMINYYLFEFVGKLKEKIYLNNKRKLISLSQFVFILKKTSLFVMIYSISVCLFLLLFIFQRDNPREMMSAMIGFIVSLFLLLSSIIYKYFIEIPMCCRSYHHLYNLGYSLKDLLSIINEEVIIYYAYVFSLPFVYTMIVFMKGYFINDLSLFHLLLFAFIEMIPIVISISITKLQYKKELMKNIKEGVHYE